MSVQVGSACYETALLAAQSVAAVETGRVVSGAAGLYALQPLSVSGSAIEYSLTPLDGGPSLASVSVPFAPQPCVLMTAADGVSLGWKLVACFAAAWGVKFLARSLR